MGELVGCDGSQQAHGAGAGRTGQLRRAGQYECRGNDLRNHGSGGRGRIIWDGSSGMTVTDRQHQGGGDDGKVPRNLLIGPRNNFLRLK